LLPRDDIVRDPLYGYIELTEEEINILDTLPLQRLRRLNPTPSASYVYPGATGNRLSHSLGVKHLAGLISENVASRLGMEEIDLRNVRIAGLIHDIGHGPLSHAFDDFLYDCGIKVNHEMIGFYILNRHQDLIRILPDYDRRLEIAYIAWGDQVLRNVGVKGNKIKAIEEKKPFIKILSDVIHGPPHCADILDFVVRDSHYTGVEYGHIDIRRLTMFTDIWRGKLAVDYRAIEAYEALILARYNMFRTVYWHRTSRAFDIILRGALKAVDDYLKMGKTLKKRALRKGMSGIVKGIPKSNKNVNDYMKLDDGFVFTLVNDICGSASDKNVPNPVYLAAYRLLHREFPKMAYRRPETNLWPELRRAMKALGLRSFDEVITIWKQQIVKDLKRKLSSEDIIIDMPSLYYIPVHARPGKPTDIVFFERVNGQFRDKQIPQSSFLYMLDPTLLEFRIYTFQENLKNKIKKVCEKRWGREEIKPPSRPSTQA